MRYLALIAVLCALGGCAGHVGRDVAMVNPRTGETTTCPASPLNPWSQQAACVAGHIAEGWTRANGY